MAAGSPHLEPKLQFSLLLNSGHLFSSPFPFLCSATNMQYAFSIDYVDKNILANVNQKKKNRCETERYIYLSKLYISFPSSTHNMPSELLDN